MKDGKVAMNLDELNDQLLQFLWNKKLRKDSERGLTAQDYEMFDRALTRYEETEKELYLKRKELQDVKTTDARLHNPAPPNRGKVLQPTDKGKRSQSPASVSLEPGKVRIADALFACLRDIQ